MSPILALVSTVHLDMSSTVMGWINKLISGLIGIFITAFQNLLNGIVNGIVGIINAFSGAIGTALQAWGLSLSAEGIIIPIVIVGVLGISFLLFKFFIIGSTFEGDIAHEEQDVEEEE